MPKAGGTGRPRPSSTSTPRHDEGLRRAVESLAALARPGTPIVPTVPHPDAELLGLAAEILDLRAEWESIINKWDQDIRQGRKAANIAQRQQIKQRLQKAMVTIGRLPATTPAGLFARAAVVRASHGYAPRLALRLANELLESSALRRAVWPVDAGGSGMIARLPSPANSNPPCDLPDPCPMARPGGSDYRPGQFVAAFAALTEQYRRAGLTRDAARRRPRRPRLRLVE